MHLSEMPSRPLRRSVAVLACLSCLLVPQVASPTPAGSRAARFGEAGSGPPVLAEPRFASAAASDRIRWSDVNRKHWARTAIDYVGETNDWMRDHRADAEGRYPFEPDVLESRKLFARAIVRAFASGTEPDPELRFTDLPRDDRFFPFANVAVSSGWMTAGDDGTFRPGDAITMTETHRALVYALGLRELAHGADALHTADGTRIDTPKDFGTTLIGMRLGLRYNHGTESMDVGPDSALPRAEVAWSLYRAATAPDWVRSSLGGYADIELPNLTDRMVEVVNFAVRYVGYPYVWGGDWGGPTPSGYCCGYQPIGGFDCSGLTWWVMKKSASGWDNTPPRPYAGWELPQRSSTAMASVGGRIRFKDLEPGDLMLYDGDGDGTVDHVDTFIGNGWAIDSGGSNGGVTITYVWDNWYQDHFKKGRRIID